MDCKDKCPNNPDKIDGPIDPEPPVFMFKSHYNTAKCMDMQTNGQNVYMFPCHGGNNQRWVKNAEVYNSKHADASCLHWDQGSDNVNARWCHEATNEKFYWEGSQLRSRENEGMCVEWDNRREFHIEVEWIRISFWWWSFWWPIIYWYWTEGTNVVMNYCHMGSNQQWLRIAVAGGTCGCEAADGDRDGDGTLNCFDECPDDYNKAPGTEANTRQLLGWSARFQASLYTLPTVCPGRAFPQCLKCPGATQPG